ncbi:MAG: hypothetical protein K6B41_06035 [Butyrivibrio sp.]|nr:hypothetical protein [Butyrivibrio sp.]
MSIFKNAILKGDNEKANILFNLVDKNVEILVERGKTEEEAYDSLNAVLESIYDLLHDAE